MLKNRLESVRLVCPAFPFVELQDRLAFGLHLCHRPPLQDVPIGRADQISNFEECHQGLCANSFRPFSIYSWTHEVVSTSGRLRRGKLLKEFEASHLSITSDLARRSLPCSAGTDFRV